MIVEKQLISNLQAPETRDKAFSLLVDTYKERLYWHIRRIVLQHDFADDVLQNTFIKVHSHIQNFKGESALYSWMYRIATNEALSYLKTEARKGGLNTSEFQAQQLEGLPADVYFDGDQIALALQKAIASLPEKQGIVFNMRYYEEMPYENMSEILETSVGALKASYHLALKKLKKYLETH
ncbi:MAG: RNA polymerase sigma factor [Flavobacteriia bacterium]|nr:RNA polymerase sigma factor [Flavobacteriia bacterium]